MLSVTSLEKINGHSADVFHDTAIGYSATTECDCGADKRRIWAGWYESEAAALEMLREEVLAEHKLIVMDRANWACSNCGRIAGMMAHHKVFRSRQRDDRVSNLVSLCLVCHDREHAGKK